MKTDSAAIGFFGDGMIKKFNNQTERGKVFLPDCSLVVERK
jgi:hypothetical protein